MARRRRRRSFGALDIPSLSDSVKVQDVLVGLLVGIGGSAVLKMVINKVAPSFNLTLGKLGKLLPLATTAVAGAVAYMVQDNKSRATGQAIGAVAAGATLSIIDYLREAKPLGLDFGAPAVALNLGNYGGLLVNNAVQRPMAGLIVDNNANLGQLGAVSMGGDDEMGYADIVALRS